MGTRDRDHIGSGPATLLLKVKPPGQLVLVSDAVAAMGLPDGELRADGEVYVIEDGRVRVKKNGRLAGSATSLLEGVRRLIADTGVPLRVMRQVLLWFSAGKQPELFRRDRFPIFIADVPDRFVPCRAVGTDEQREGVVREEIQDGHALARALHPRMRDA